MTTQSLDDIFVPDRQFLIDDTPKLQSASRKVDYVISYNDRLAECPDLVCFPPEFSSDLQQISKIQKMVTCGEIVAQIIYSYRGLNKVIPAPARGSTKADIEALNAKTFEVLKPEIDKIKSMYDFQREAISSFATCVDNLIRQGKKKVISESLLDSLISLVAIIQQIDRIKDSKSCLMSDLMRYKKVVNSVISADQISREDGAILDAEITALSNFLSNVGTSDKATNQDRIISRDFRNTLRNISSSDDILSRLLQRSVDRLTLEYFLTPKEKHAMLRSLPYLLWLSDGDDSSSGSSDGFNAFKQKKVKMLPVQKFFQRYSFVPDIGDIPFQLLQALNDAPHLTPEVNAQFSPSFDTKIIEEMTLPLQRVRIAEEHATYITAFQCALTAGKNGNAKLVTSTVAAGLRLLERWSSLLLEVHACKISNPVNESTVLSAAGADADVNQYARAVRFNYSQKELTAVAEIVSAIKSLASILIESEPDLSPYIRSYIHSATQQLIQGDMLPILHRADKKKRGVLTQLLSLRSLLADWSNDSESKNDYREYKRKEGKISATFPRRVVATSVTQLEYIRYVLYSICDDSSELRQGSGLMSKEDLTKDDIDVFMDFFRESYMFPYLLDLNGTIKACSDLGDLWFREYHLELTQKIQFPLEQSFPWILTEHMVRSSGMTEADASVAASTTEFGSGANEAAATAAVLVTPTESAGSTTLATLPKRKKKKKGPEGGAAALAEAVLYILDIYNDAAQKALYGFRSQHLFDEIQAEIGVAHIQLVFQLESELYGHCKDWAASTSLDKLYRKRAEERRGWGRYTPAFRKHTALIRQCHATLLGRNVDFSRRFALDLTAKLQEDLEVSISRFEKGGLSKVFEFKMCLDAIEGTHRMLKKAGLTGLDPMEDFISDALTKDGRLATYILKNLVMDLFPNYRLCFETNRWVNLANMLNESKGSGALGGDSNLGAGRLCGKAFEQVSSLSSEFVGEEHVACVLSMLSSSELISVIEGVLQYMESKLDDILDWARAITPGLPSLVMPPFSESLSNTFSDLKSKLKPLIEYSDLSDGLFQDFKEFGNGVMFLIMVDNLIKIQDCLNFVHGLPIIGAPASRTWELESTRVMDAIQTVSLALTDVDDITENALTLSAALVENIRRGADVTSAASTSQSLFNASMKRLDMCITAGGVREEWEGDILDGIMKKNCSQALYQRFWSAVHFVYCQPYGLSNTTSFWVKHGDGVTICGATILLLLKQEDIHENEDIGSHLFRTDIYERVCASAPVSDRGRPEAEAYLWYVKQQRAVLDWVLEHGKEEYTTDDSIPTTDITFHPPLSEKVQTETTRLQSFGVSSPISTVPKPNHGSMDSFAGITSIGSLFSEMDLSSQRDASMKSAISSSSPTKVISGNESVGDSIATNVQTWPSPIGGLNTSLRPTVTTVASSPEQLSDSRRDYSVVREQQTISPTSPIEKVETDDSSVQSLKEAFPHVPENEIVYVLRNSGGDVRVAGSVLADRTPKKSPSRKPVSSPPLKSQYDQVQRRPSALDSTPIDVLFPMVNRTNVVTQSPTGSFSSGSMVNSRADVISDLDPDKVANYKLERQISVPLQNTSTTLPDMFPRLSSHLSISPSHPVAPASGRRSSLPEPSLSVSNMQSTALNPHPRFHIPNANPPKSNINPITNVHLPSQSQPRNNMELPLTTQTQLRPQAVEANLKSPVSTSKVVMPATSVGMKAFPSNTESRNEALSIKPSELGHSMSSRPNKPPPPTYAAPVGGAMKPLKMESYSMHNIKNSTPTFSGAKEFETNQINPTLPMNQTHKTLQKNSMYEQWNSSHANPRFGSPTQNPVSAPQRSQMPPKTIAGQARASLSQTSHGVIGTQHLGRSVSQPYIGQQLQPVVSQHTTGISMQQSSMFMQPNPISPQQTFGYIGNSSQNQISHEHQSNTFTMNPPQNIVRSQSNQQSFTGPVQSTGPSNMQQMSSQYQIPPVQTLQANQASQMNMMNQMNQMNSAPMQYMQHPTSAQMQNSVNLQYNAMVGMQSNREKISAMEPNAFGSPQWNGGSSFPNSAMMQGNMSTVLQSQNVNRYPNQLMMGQYSQPNQFNNYMGGSQHFGQQQPPQR